MQLWSKYGVKVSHHRRISFFSFLRWKFNLGKIWCNLDVYKFCDYLWKGGRASVFFKKNGHDMQFARTSIGLLGVVILSRSWVLEFLICVNLH